MPFCISVFLLGYFLRWQLQIITRAERKYQNHQYFSFLDILADTYFYVYTEVNKETCPAYYFWIDYRNSYYPFWWCGSLYMYWWSNSCDKLFQGNNTSLCFSLFPLQLVFWHEMCLGLSLGGRSDPAQNRLCVLASNIHLHPRHYIIVNFQ